MILQQLVNGLTLGSLYALIALGYTLVYGVLLMINFAHSEVFMIGAFVGVFVLGLLSMASSPGVTLLLAFAGAMAACGVLAALMERIAYRPLRHASRLAPLISAIGVSLLLQNAVFLWVSDQSLPFPQVIHVNHYRWGQVEMSSLQAVILIVSLALMGLLHAFVKKTRLGTAIRATAQDASTASLMGVNVHRVIALTFFLGGALGGVAGVLNGMYYGAIKYNMGFVPGIKAFTAAVLGGIGNIPGAMLGGYLLGLLEAASAGLFPAGAEWKDVIAFSVLILVLLFRPEGLLGQRISEKV